MASMEEVSHSEIYRELGVLHGKMDSMILSMTRQEQDRAEIYRRVGILESRMAQVVIIAALLGLVLPTAFGWIMTRFESQTIQQIERSK